MPGRTPTKDHASTAAAAAAAAKQAAADAALAAAKTAEPGDQGDGAPADSGTAAPVAETIAEPQARMASAKEGTCGFPVAGSQGAKPCVKEPGHEGDHAIRAYKPRPDVSAVKIEGLAPESFAADEELEITEEAPERKEPQVTVDAQVKAAHEEWLAKGKPTTFPAAIKAGVAKRYFLDPEQEDAYRTLLRAAGRFLKLRVKIAPIQKHTSGKHMLPWIAMDMRASQASTPSAGVAADSAASGNGEAAKTE